MHKITFFYEIFLVGFIYNCANLYVIKHVLHTKNPCVQKSSIHGGFGH